MSEALAAMHELHRRGIDGWPGIVVAFEPFAAEVTRRLGGDASVTVVVGLHHDVYLAIAAAQGDEAAAAACDAVGSREIGFAATRLRATPTQADDIRSELRRLLFTGDGERRAAIASFNGRGDLRGFLRVIVARALCVRMRRDRREVSIEDGVIDALDALDPEVALLREAYRTDVDAAFRAALATLSVRARAVLRYHLLDGWSIDQIGERYGVHRSSAARWVRAAHDELGAGIRTQLAARLAIPESQVASIVALVTSRIDVSLERLLAG